MSLSCITWAYYPIRCHCRYFTGHRGPVRTVFGQRGERRWRTELTLSFCRPTGTQSLRGHGSVFDTRSADLPARRETEVRNLRGSTGRNLCGRAGKSSWQLHISSHGANRTLRGVPLRRLLRRARSVSTHLHSRKMQLPSGRHAPKTAQPAVSRRRSGFDWEIERHDAVTLLKPTAVDRSSMLGPVQTARRDCRLRAKVRPRAAENQRERPR
jgi:hypothetical protein